MENPRWAAKKKNKKKIAEKKKRKLRANQRTLNECECNRFANEN